MKATASQSVQSRCYRGWLPQKQLQFRGEPKATYEPAPWAPQATARLRWAGVPGEWSNPAPNRGDRPCAPMLRTLTLEQAHPMIHMQQSLALKLGKETKMVDHYSAPVCLRYESDGEEDRRVLLVWAIACGLVGGGEAAGDMTAQIACLYDHKGILFVVLHDGETLRWIEPHLRKAWECMGGEVADNVEFVALSSDHWRSVWNSRRFDKPYRSPGAPARS